LLEYTFPNDKLKPRNGVAPGRVPAVIVACGSFNPVTFLHLRLFECARDCLHHSSQYQVVGAYFSPVNDKYAKKDLLPAVHRVAMCQLGASSSDWIMTDPWETLQSEYVRTRVGLEHFEQHVNADVQDGEPRTRVFLLCGSDLLESFEAPGVWDPADVRTILRDFGVVCIEREGSDPNRIIYESDLLSAHSRNIHVFREWILNDVSSTEVRRHIRRGLSVKYLTPDPVVHYIHTHGLYKPKE
jgi:nicotinamide mononucleotide adenylyltransferase